MENFYYNDRTKNGSTIGHGGQQTPRGIEVSGQEVEFKGQMSRKAFDSINEEGLVLSSAEHGKLWCASHEDAEKVAGILRENPVYPKQ